MSYASERDAAFIKAVMDDDWKAVRRFAKKHQINIPKSRKALKAGIYKAVRYCTDIPEEVKDVAFTKCLMLGLSPMIREAE